MDLQRDYAAFKKLITRLCDTLGKPPSDELVESWWKALRHAEFSAVERKVDDFLARATETTRFPRPSQLRPEGSAPNVASDGEDYHRGFWRSLIINTIAEDLDLTMASIEPIIVANRGTLGAWMLVLLNDICGKDHDRSQNLELQALCQNEARKIAQRFTGQPRTIEQHSDNWQGDNWDIAANRHFFAHVLRRVMAKQEPYDRRGTKTMLVWKAKWASDMREEDRGKGVDPQYQREVWEAYMRQGHSEIEAGPIVDASLAARAKAQPLKHEPRP